MEHGHLFLFNVKSHLTLSLSSIEEIFLLPKPVCVHVHISVGVLVFVWIDT